MNNPLTETELERIRKLECLYNEWEAMLPALQAAQTQWREARAKLDELKRYYHSEQWMRDVEADSTGRIPTDMPRGILAEDTLYNAFHEEYQLAVEWVQLGAEALRRD
ncbi:MAG: DUF4298 domain-containing protein [Lautropia sp.]|nr:DUF4298 domain-containing protein [Lautropia sp.]